MAQHPAPTGVTVRYQGSAGGTTNWYYWVQALYPSGYSQLSAPGNTGAKALAALTNNNVNNVQWNPSPGAIGYIVYRSTSSTTPANGGNAIFLATAETGFKDDGSLATFSQVPRYDGLYVAHAIYNFAVDGGVHTSAIVPKLSDTIPLGAIVVGGVAYGVTNLGGATNVSIGTTAGSAADSIMASAAIAGLNAGLVVELLGTNSQAATHKPAFRMTAAGQINMTFTVADVTAGCFEVLVFYVLPSN
jgi:hypothetical protein